MSGTAAGSLTNTLVLALTQCQEQVQTIGEQSLRIEKLQQENKRLRKELEDAKQAPPLTEPEASSQAEDLFQKNVEAQAELQILRKKLRAYKEKASLRLSAPISSPITTPVPSSPKQAPSRKRMSDHTEASAGHDIDLRASPPPPKRSKLGPGVVEGILQEIPVNTAHSRSSSTTASKKGESEKKAAAISALAEDGESHMLGDNNAPITATKLQRDDSAYHRLGGLLAAPSPGRSPLARTRSTSPAIETVSSRSHRRRLPAISNIKHVTTADSTAKPDRSGNGSKQGRTSRSSMKGPEDDEPLRARPLNRLSLMHFKPNPRWLDSHGVSYDEFLRGPNAERINMLAETLPYLPGQARRGRPPTDHEILFDYLGPGSETRIASMTEVARKNLVMEAKTKRVAAAFAKQRVDYDHDKTAPGFWSTDMPGTQEDEENKELARKREREDIRKRYEDAIGGDGRWIFADE